VAIYFLSGSYFNIGLIIEHTEGVEVLLL